MSEFLNLEKVYKDRPEVKEAAAEDPSIERRLTNKLYEIAKNETGINIPYGAFVSEFNPKDEFASFINFRKIFR